MRTLKILAGFGAALLIATGANAAVVFSVSNASDADTAQEVDLSVTLSGGTGNALLAFQLDWLLDGANVPLSAVETPGSVPGPGPNTTCVNTNNQFMCAFGGMTTVGSAGSNDVGDNWLWDPSNPTADGTYNLGRFTFTAGASGLVSIGQCEILDFDVNEVPCSSNSVAIVPEPTTVALLGLGLFGLALGGRRR